MSKSNIIIFYNKNSARLLAPLKEVQEKLEKQGRKVTVTASMTPEMLVNGQQSRLVVLGGDGTINRIVNKLFELKEADSTLVIPELVLTNSGTGSDYIKSVYGKEHAKNWQQHLIDDKLQARAVDVGLISGTAKGKKFKKYFVNILGVGLSGDVVHDKNKNEKKYLLSKIPKSMAYVLPAIKNILTYRPTVTSIQIDGDCYSIPLKVSFVAKGSYSGGGMKFGRNANLFDGEFEVTVVGDMGLLDLYRNLRSIFSGEIAANNKIMSKKCRHIAFQFSEPISVEYDGELLTGVTDLNVEMIRTGLPVCFSPSCDV